MSLDTHPFDPARYVRSDAGAVAYIESAFASGDAAVIADALGVVARARSAAVPADGRPELAGVVELLSTLGLQLSVLKREAA